MATTHTVTQGECLSSIARRYGFSNWRTIYEHPRNSEFKHRRPNPNLIYPGDQLFIPDKTPKDESVETSRPHVFRVHRQRTLLRIALRDEARQPLAGKPYTLKVNDTAVTGVTDGNGLLEQAIPADAQQGELTLRLEDDPASEAYTWTLKIGHLDPVEEISGVQARLNSLGFDCGAVDGINGPDTEDAVCTFQRKYRLTADGIAGPETQTKLKEVYGC